MTKLKTILATTISLFAFFIMFPLFMYLAFVVLKSMGLWWVDTIGWWWNYWFSLIQ